MSEHTHIPAEGARAPSGPAPEPWDAELVERLRAHFGSGLRAAGSYLGQNYLEVELSACHQLLSALRQEGFDYLVDVTAVHFPTRERPFRLVWILYSFEGNERVRVEAEASDGEPVASVTDLWPAANWLEREVFDMFGIRFAGHPDLRRILLPEDWQGHPLRKDYGIIQQDQAWVQKHLGIESGQ